MKSWRSLLLDNLPLKAISILLAILVWHQVSQQQTPWQIVSIPLGFKMPPGLVITNDYPTQVEVYARSHRSAGVDPSQLNAVIDLPGAMPGTQVIQLTEKNINRPAHVEIDSITPAMIRLEIENLVSKTVRVQPRYQGKPAEGYEVTAVRVVPNEIRVSGPASRVSATDVIPTIPIDISGKRQSVTQNAFVELDDSELRIDNDLSLLVSVQIEEKRRDVRVQKVAVTAVPEGVPARLGTTTVDLIGSVPVSWSGELDASLFQVQVDLSQAEPSSNYSEFNPQVTIPPEYANIFRLARTRPEKIKARRTR